MGRRRAPLRARVKLSATRPEVEMSHVQIETSRRSAAGPSRALGGASAIALAALLALASVGCGRGAAQDGQSAASPGAAVAERAPVRVRTALAEARQQPVTLTLD